jgi:hypothetical protein
MKREQREKFYELAKVGTPLGFTGLCNFCHYARFEGTCKDSELYCECFNEKVRDNSWDIWAGDQDCWAFRPSWPWEQTVMILQAYLLGYVPDTSEFRRAHETRTTGVQVQSGS